MSCDLTHYHTPIKFSRGEFAPPIPAILVSVGLEVLVPEKNISTGVHSKSPTSVCDRFQACNFKPSLFPTNSKSPSSSSDSAAGSMHSGRSRLLSVYCSFPCPFTVISEHGSIWKCPSESPMHQTPSSASVK